MKIVYILKGVNYANGLVKSTLIQADYFIKNFNYKIEFILIDEKSDNLNPKFLINENIKLHYLDINSKGLKRFFYKVKGLDKKLKQIVPDIVMVCNNEIFGLNIPSLVKKNQPFINQRRGSRNLNLDIYKNINKITYCLKNILLSVSGFGYDRFVLLTDSHKKDWQHLNSDKLVVIGNPNTSITSANLNQAKLDNKVVIAVGRQNPVKGFDMLLQAWQKIINDNPGWVLKFYGEINESLGLEKMAKDLGLNNTVQFNTHTNDLVSAYLESSFLVCPSRSEAFGLVLIEAMALGVPVISFNCDHGPGDIITDNEDGILVEPNDIEQLSISMQTLISNDKIRKSMGAKASENVKRFDLDKIMNKWKNLIEEVLTD